MLILQERTLITQSEGSGDLPNSVAVLVRTSQIPKGGDLNQFFTFKKAVSETIMYIQIYPEAMLNFRF